jgi:hypothetical protein
MGKIKDFRKYIERKLLKKHDPDFLIIGTQKSGTTSLFYLLDKHPKLAGSWPKELHYFSQATLTKNLDWYRTHFTSLKRDPLYFEASPNYINHEYVAKRLKDLYPAIKLIVILRNPVERAYSAWNMYYMHFRRGTLRGFKNLTEGREDFPTFSETIAIEHDLIKKDLPGVNILRKGLYYDQISMYL